jgi:hypothetical protein
MVKVEHYVVGTSVPLKFAKVHVVARYHSKIVGFKGMLNLR